MPELPEVEAYRALAEATALRRRISDVEAPDAWYLKGGLSAADLQSALRGRSFVKARRIGKLALLDVEGGLTLGLRFGMTGRLVVDGVAGVERLLYSSGRDEPAWDRFAVSFEGGGRMSMRDPRRLGGVELDPDESRLGADLLTLTLAELRHALGDSLAPLKARLLDQSRVAGVGNLIGDEALWRAGLDPARPAGSLSPPEVRRLHRHLRTTTSDLMDGGGSHTGLLGPARVRGGRCPQTARPSSGGPWAGAPPFRARSTNAENSLTTASARGRITSMQFVFRVVRSACDLVFGAGSGGVGLRHPSGGYLTDGGPAGNPVLFGSAEAARVFSVRFLDEAPAWEPAAVATPRAGDQAA